MWAEIGADDHVPAAPAQPDVTDLDAIDGSPVHDLAPYFGRPT